MKHNRSALVVSSGLLALAAGACTPKKNDSAAKTDPAPGAASSIGVGEQNMSDEARDFVKDVVGITTKHQLLGFVASKHKELGGDVEGTPDFQAKHDDYRLAAILTAPLLPARSLVFRMQNIFKRREGIGDGNDPVHSMFLTWIRNAASAMPLAAPTSQWRAGFAYFTEPLAPTPDTAAKEGVKDAIEGVAPIATAQQFKTVDEAQAFVCTELLAEADLLKTRLASFQFKKSAAGLDQAIVLDAKGAFGTIRRDPEDAGTEAANAMDKVDPLNRFALIRPHDVKIMAAAAAMGAHNLRVYCAYNQNGSFEFLEKIGRFFATDRGIVLISEVEGLTAEKRKSILDGVDKNFMKLRLQPSGAMKSGPEYLEAALADVRMAVKLTEEAWPAVKKDNASHPFRQSIIGNPLVVSPFDRWTENNLAQISALVNATGPTVVTSNMTGEQVQVDFQAFYKNPAKDVREFMPRTFESGRDAQYRQETTTEGNVKFKNYFYGRPTSWDPVVYARYFPGAPNTKTAGADIRPVLRVLGSAWAGWVVAGPMAGFAM